MAGYRDQYGGSMVMLSDRTPDGSPVFVSRSNSPVGAAQRSLAQLSQPCFVLPWSLGHVDY